MRVVPVSVLLFVLVLAFVLVLVFVLVFVLLLLLLVLVVVVVMVVAVFGAVFGRRGGAFFGKGRDRRGGHGEHGLLHGRRLFAYGQGMRESAFTAKCIRCVPMAMGVVSPGVEGLSNRLR